MKTIAPPVDSTLVDRVKENGCNESYEELLSRHENLFYKICQRYMSVVKSRGLEPQDLLGDKYFVMFKAIKSFSPDKKTKFSTWLGNCARYHCLNFLNSNSKYISADDDTIKLVIDNQTKESYTDLREDLNNSEYIFNILHQLKDKRIAEVFRLRYFKDFGMKKKPTWCRIAKKINTSTQTAINLHTKGKRILKTKFMSKNTPDRI